MATQPSNVPKKPANFFSVLEREPVLAAFVIALIVMVNFYRLELPGTVYAGTEPLNDLAFIALMGLGYLGFKIPLRSWFPRVTASKIFIALEIFFGAIVLFFLALVVRTHFELLTQLDIGFTLTLLQLSPQMFSGRDFFEMLTPLDCVFIASPVAAFFLALLCGKWLKRIYKPLGIILILLVIAALFFPVDPSLPEQTTENPVIFFVKDAFQTEIFEWRSPQNDASRHAAISDTQMHSIRLVDSAFVITNGSPSPPPDRQRLAPDGKPWNILIFILESAGADYVFDTSRGNETPMPFLKKMSREGLYLSNHFATANLSARAAFSIFTGLYPPPSRKTLCMEKDLSIPTLNRYLPDGYDYFFEHPTTPTYWFPQYLFLNNHLSELDTLETMPRGHRPQITEEALNEIDCFDFLQSRIDRAQEPVLGVYWSYIPHYPYSDYGGVHILPNLSNSNRNRYYNNLHVLDDQLKRIYEHLVQTGMADRTLFVFIGDHGEAFDQHGEWGHAFGPYSETYRAPVIFWQPKLIQPQIIKFPTSHIDIVPTILDLIGVPYNPARFQGDSVLRGIPNRKYIFTTDGYASYVSAISTDMKKVSICFEKNDTTAFDLVNDPGELNPLSVSKFTDETEAIFEFRKFQTQMIPAYNQAILNHSIYPPKNTTN